MKIDTENLFGGGLAWGRVSQSAAAKEADIDPATVSRVKSGKEGFSPAAAKKAAKIAGAEPVDVYITSQVRSARKRFKAGEINAATGHRIVGRVLAGIREFPNGKVSDEVTRDLQTFAEEMTEASSSPATTSVTKRDAFGRRVKKKEKATTKSAPGVMGKLGRNADGTSRRKVV